MNLMKVLKGDAVQSWVKGIAWVDRNHQLSGPDGGREGRCVLLALCFSECDSLGIPSVLLREEEKKTILKYISVLRSAFFLELTFALEL